MLDARPGARIVGPGLDRAPDVVAAIRHGVSASVRKPVRLDEVRQALTLLDAEGERGTRIR